ncbi:MAG: hypothetical protein DME61_11060, partial [Verrucomicrobia bacterium]
ELYRHMANGAGNSAKVVRFTAIMADASPLRRVAPRLRVPSSITPSPSGIVLDVDVEARSLRGGAAVPDNSGSEATPDSPA